MRGLLLGKGARRMQITNAVARTVRAAASLCLDWCGIGRVTYFVSRCSPMLSRSLRADLYNPPLSRIGNGSRVSVCGKGVADLAFKSNLRGARGGDMRHVNKTEERAVERQLQRGYLSE